MVAGLRILEQRVQHVLEADEIVTALGGDAEGAANALEGVGRERNGCAAHARAPSGSGSSVTSNGNSCCSASCLRGLDLGLGDVAGEQAGDADAGLVHVHHHGVGLRAGHVEDGFEHPHHEFLGGEVVVVQQHAPQARVLDPLIGARLGLHPIRSLRNSHLLMILRAARRARARRIGSDVLRRSGQVGVESPIRRRLAHQPRHFRDERAPRHRRSAPSDSRWSVSSWQSIQGNSQRSSWAARYARAIFEASVRRENIDSPKNIRPRRDAVDAAGQRAVHPHFDRMRESLLRAARDRPPSWAASARCRRRPGRGAAHASSTAANAASTVTVKRRCLQPLLRANARRETRAGASTMRGSGDHQRIGIAVVEPREDAVAVGGDQPARREVGAGRQQAVGLVERLLDRRERVGRAEKGIMLSREGPGQF